MPTTKKLNFSPLPQSQKSKTKSERIIPFVKGKSVTNSPLKPVTGNKEQPKRNPTSALPILKEDTLKKKDKLKEKKTVPQSRKRLTNDNVPVGKGISSTPQNITDYKSVKKKPLKKLLPSRNKVTNPVKPAKTNVAVTNVRRIEIKKDKVRKEVLPNVEALRTKLIAIEISQKKAKEEKKIIPGPEEVKKVKPIDTTNLLFTPIKPLMLPPKPVTNYLPVPAQPITPVTPLVQARPGEQTTTIPLPKVITKLNYPLTFERLDHREINEVEDERKLTPEIQSKLAFHVTKCIQQKKVFAMACSNFSSIRTALIKRGWIQKFASEEPSLRTGQIPPDPEAQFTQRLLRNVPLSFVWVYSVNDWNDIKSTTLVNRFPRAAASYTFTTKIGLNQYLQQSHWYNEKGVAEVKFPRTHSILNQEDLLGFIEDYVMTSCICLLKLIVMVIVQAEHNIFKDGDIPLDVIDFAVERCREYVAFREHRDLDRNDDNIKANEESIKRFLQYFYRLVHEGGKFQTATYLQTQGIYLSAKSALQEIQKFWPEMKLDGFKNLWLLKQSNLNCGRGVKILTTLDSIINTIGEVKSPKYVIQKYIERPLLIYDTKFDIRQWILLTGVNPIQIWMYDECYLRFSSQVFTLNDTSESVHLCNNVIQKKYKNATRHQSLPAENMWDGTRFKKYLEEIGEQDKWETIIYPGMKENIIATIMAAQESMIDRVNSFELYGIDFMLTEDYRPWLIEINSSPAMGPTTSVTGRLCGQCLADIIKVVVDRLDDPEADTGRFKLIYNQEARTSVRMMSPDFEIHGRRIPLLTRNSLLLSKEFAKNQLKRSHDVTDLCRTDAGQQLKIVDTPSNNVISKLKPENLAGEFYYIDKQYKPAILKERRNKKSVNKHVLTTLSEVPNETTGDIITNLPVETSEQRAQVKKENVVEVTKNVTKLDNDDKEPLVEVIPENSGDFKMEIKISINPPKSNSTEKLANEPEISTVTEPSTSKPERSVEGVTESTTGSNEGFPLLVDKSTNTKLEFDHLPIGKILNLADDNQLQYLGCKILQGQNPLNYKIYYSKTRSRFIVDIEDSNKELSL